jgi:hypothetical protein
VTDRPSPDERLRDAFQALGQGARDELSAADVERVWRAVSGELSAEERRELVDRMATNPALADAWRVAQELWREVPQVEPAASDLGTWPRRWLAAAAALLLVVSAGLFVQFSPDPGDTFRDPNRYVVETPIPRDATLPRGAFRLRWTAGPEDARYRVRVTTDDLRMLTTAADLTVPEFVVDARLLAGVAPGARVLWQVDVTLPGGESVSSETFVVRVQ